MESNQSGRSMIEMLGVLAIIGVLSVGGLVGYNKTMLKHRINATIEQISHIAVNIQNLYAGQRTYAGLDSYSDLDMIKKAKLVPENMIDESSTVIAGDSGLNINILNKFGGGVYIIDDTQGYGDYKGFTINYFDLPEDACIELATHDWSGLPGLKTLALHNYIDMDTVNSLFNCLDREGAFEYYNDGGISITACPGGSVVPIPIPLSLAVQACNCPDKHCSIVFGFQ